MRLGIALRYLKSRKQEGFISLISLLSTLGIMIGVATLIISMSISHGFRRHLIDTMTPLSGNITISDISMSKAQDIIKSLEGDSKITDIYPIQYCIVLQSLKNPEPTQENIKKMGHSVFFGMNAKDILNNKRLHVIQGALDISGNNVLISDNLTKNQLYKVNTDLYIASGKTIPTPFGNIPVIGKFHIAGIIKGDNDILDNSIIGTPQSISKISDQSKTIVSIILKNPENGIADVPFVKSNHFHYIDTIELNRNFLKAIGIENAVMFIVLSMIVLIAVFNIVSSLIMLVQDKRRDIAIFKSMGMDNRSILLIFMYAGSFIGIVGTLLGDIIGLAIAYNLEPIRHIIEYITGVKLLDPNVYHVNTIPCDIDAFLVFKISCLSMFFSVISTLYPAYKSAKLEPIKEFRNE